MKTTTRRVALLTGASLAAIGMSALAATPALAQTAPHEGLADGTYAGVDTTDDTVVICDLAEADPNCFFGVIDTTNPAVSIVNSTATGRIYQHDAGGAVVLDMSNATGDTAEVGAIASGTTGAQASVSYAIEQTATGTDVTLNFDNDGYLLIDALAVAAGGVALTANAGAEVYAGVGQSANATLVDINHTNDGTISAIASAVATAANVANASANNSYAVWQYGSGDTVALAVQNNGLLNVEANAVATADDAEAYANAYWGIWQDATAATAGSLNVVNSGTFNMVADASANGGIYASASASANDGVFQDLVSGGTGAVSFTNNGVVNVSAEADAVATGLTGDAYAYAYAYDAVYQSVSAASTATAAVVLGAGGTAGGTGEINLNADANAVGVTYASASASVAEGIQQEVDAGIAGLASVTNGGVISLAANAAASATSGGASASAYAYNGILQDVSAGSAGTAFVANSGTVALAASAVALGTGFVSASASASGGIVQDVNGGTAALASVTNAGLISLDAFASASGSHAHAYAYAYDGIAQDASAGTIASALAINSGTISLNASAVAVASTHASASASASGGIVQDVDSGGTGLAQATNVGLISIAAHASAAGSEATADAYAYDGISQSVDALTAGAAVAVNSGTIALAATALASGTSSAYASAEAGGGIRQDVSAATALLQATNVGAISLAAYASASGPDASASAQAYTGISQDIGGLALVGTQSAINSGTISLAATAVANGFDAVGGTADAYASAYGGIVQYGTIAAAGELNALIANTGAVVLSANATASAGANASAEAFAGSALAQFQSAGAAAVVNATITNGGTVTATANAVAVAGDNSLVDSANAEASAYGIGQHIDGGSVNYVINNSGTLNVGAHATATAQEQADAFAYVTAVYQVLHGDTNTALFTNSGVLNANASAIANATDPDVGLFTTATATAIGYAVGGGAGTVTAVNSGTMNVSATAIATAGYASANAAGMVASGIAGSVSLSNAGTLSVVASASGTSSSANAGGMGVLNSSGVINVTNSGTLAVDAITAGNGPANATGIIVTTAGVPVLGDTTTVTNSGDIIVRESEDGGDTWRRGMAIDLAGSLNPNVVNLLGGNIYGNIDINAGDEINVADGTTYFDGIINPEFVPVGGVVEATLDTGLFGEGTLNIGADGNLILADPRITGDPDTYDGPAYAFVETFNMDPAGTITFELQPAEGGIQPVGTYPQIFTNVANLDGTLVADVTPAGGLFSNEGYFWDNVIDAVTRNGEFDQCVLAGAYADSPLLTGAFDGDICDYDDANNVDLGVVRIAFNEVGGLNINQLAAAGGLECLYEDLDAEGLAALAGTGLGEAIAELFLFDGAGYAGALQQLAGAGYAGYLQSFNSLGYHYNQILARATDCEIPALAGSALACRVAPMHLWGQVDYDTLSQDGDVELGDYDADRWSFLIGGDISVTPAAVVGVSVGKVTNKVDYDGLEGRVKGDGWQFGAYGTYDPGQFYVKALGTYTKMDGDGDRGIDFTDFGGTIAGNIEGDADVRMWTFGLHGGYRIPMGPSSVITPFLNYDYTNAKLKGFTETGDTGVELTVNGGREKHSWLTGGVKWAGQMGGLVPEASIGYRHMFGDRRASFNANFAGFEEDCDFDIVSMTEKRGSVLAGLSVGGLLGMVDVRVGYNGAFNSDMQEHSGFLKLVLPLGAVAAPPPPVVIAPPPPPPAPATQTCPDGSVILATDVCPAPPPPPPPPAPAPERG